MNRVILKKLTLEDRDLIVDMLDEWTEYNATHVTDHSPGAIFRDYSNFEKYVEESHEQETNPKEGFVPGTTYFAFDQERKIYVGAVQIRHYLNEALRNGGGHIGDGVRPSERRKGYATEIIALALEKCREMEINPVMISCNETNIGSRKSILRNGGVYEKTVVEDGENLEIYWIHL